MAYTYQVSFDITRDQMDELKIGSSLERVLAYLRTLLPNEPGFISAKALYSVDVPDKTRVVFESSWYSWEDLMAHRDSALLEDKVLVEFGPHMDTARIETCMYGEVD